MHKNKVNLIKEDLLRAHKIKLKQRERVNVYSDA